ncbi:hypothetical protein THIOSC13_430011 [uncultured Thiomicrorhabdus sp.]
MVARFFSLNCNLFYDFICHLLLLEGFTACDTAPPQIQELNNYFSLNERPFGLYSYCWPIILNFIHNDCNLSDEKN